MRCPKCHYISFGSSDRCRNCGYEFALAPEAPAVDLPIQSDDPALGPLADFVLTERGPAPPTPSVFTASTGHASTAASRASTGSSRFDLPLFGGAEAGDDAPLVTPSAIPRTPLAVRRGQPPIPRPRFERAPQSDTPEPESSPNPSRSGWPFGRAGVSA